ncbi:MAG: SPFH domain-containing protein [Myxococcales bacterium]|jgi:membrane protease subunit (stomatin/prohibitin family)|nr:SPFH domain-containing protein [Myxococcales bacterium]
MSIMNFIKRGVQEMMIARSDEAKEHVVYKHPDRTVPAYSQLTVDSDEVALFFRDGKPAGRLPAGRHTLDSSNIPFLSNLIDSFTGGNVFVSEIYFVSTRAFTGVKFGGRIGDVEDPKSGIPVGIMVHGEFAIRVTEPEKLILGLLGMRQVDNDSFFSWFKQQVLKVIRDQIAEQVVKQKMPILDVVSGAYTEEIETTVLQGVGRHVEEFGVIITQLGNFVIDCNEDDKQNLKKLYTEAAQIRMVGGMQGYQQFAAAKAMMGAGEGMAKGGGGGEGGGAGGMLGGAGLGVGFGMAQMFQANQMQAQYAQPQGQPGMPQPQAGNLAGTTAPAAAPAQQAGGVTCANCNATVPGGKFCPECGQPLPVATGPKFCPECGNKMTPGAKFCPECGNKFDG